jgi:hypothetical protein
MRLISNGRSFLSVGIHLLILISSKTNPVKSFFGISDTISPTTVFTSENTFEIASPYWSAPDLSKITKTGRNNSFLLEPGAYSVSFEYELDSLAAYSGGYIIRANVWAKLNPEPRRFMLFLLKKMANQNFGKPLRLAILFTTGKPLIL